MPAGPGRLTSLVSGHEQRLLGQPVEFFSTAAGPDSAPERLTRLIARVFQSAVLVQRAGEEPGWFTAAPGGAGQAEPASLPPELLGFLAGSGGLLDVPDTWADARFQAWLPTPGACVSAALTGPCGEIRGSLSLLHAQPRAPLTAHEQDTLREFAQLLTDELVRHDTHQALLREQQRQRWMLANADTMFWEFTPATGRLRLSGEAQDLGLDTHTLPGTLADWAALLHPQDRERAMTALTTAVQRAEPYADRYRVVTTGGEVAWVRAQGQPEYRPCGTLSAFVGTVQNVTAQTQREQALQESQARLRAVLESIPDSITLKDAGGRYQMINHATTVLFDRSAPDVLGQTDETLLDPFVSAQVRTADERVRMTGQPYTFESTVGGRILMTSKHPYRLGTETLGVVSVSRDVSEHRHLEQQLERQVSLTGSLLQSLPGAFVALDRQGRFTYANVTAERLLGFAPGTLIGREVRDVCSWLRGSELEQQLTQVAAGRGPLRCETQSPETGEWYEVHAAPAPDGLAVSFLNVTARRHMEETLLSLNETLERRVQERTAELQDMVARDALTRLPNRRAFDDALDEALRDAAEQGAPLYLLLLDLDDLQGINDRDGRKHGDYLLQCFASALQEVFAGHGQVFRLGGDEFTVLLTGRHWSGSELRAQLERVSHSRHWQAAGAPRASVGSVAFPADAQAANDLLRLADQRMLREKTARRATRGLADTNGDGTLGQLSTDMLWQAARATSALIRSDGTVGRDGWQSFLHAAVAALPGAEAGSLYMLEGDTFVMVAQTGYSDALLGAAHAAPLMKDWYGPHGDWEAGEARVLRDAALIAKLARSTFDPAAQPAVLEAFEVLGEFDHLQVTVAVPVVVSGRVVALLNLDNLRAHDAFGPQELRTAEEFARQAAAMLATHERRAREQARTRELEVLSKVNAALGSVRRPEDIERVLVEEARALLRTEHVAFAQYEAHDDALHLLFRSGTFQQETCPALPRGQGITWQAVTTGQVIHVARTDLDERVCHTGHLLSGALIAAPLPAAPGVPMSAILAMRPAPEVFTDLDGRLLGALAAAGVAAFERVHAAAEERRRAEELRLLSELSEFTGAADDASTVARQCLTACRTFLNADVALFVPADPDDTWADGTFPETGPLGEAPAVTAGRLLGAGPYRATHTYATLDGAHPALVQAGLQAAVKLPVMERGERAGLVALLWFRPLPALPDAAAPLLMRAAELIGHALDRQAHIADVEATREGALLALGLSLELRDFETAGHTERVVRLALAVGRAMGLDDTQLETLRVGAYLHDIGKLAVPDAILLKPGRLDPEEWTVMQSHAATGHALVSRIPTLPQGAKGVVRHHHERWDGGGYPDRLAGEAIPVAARIFSVVDVFDALTSERPYKHAWPAEDALQEIQAQAGRQFDPQVVQVALAVLTAGEAQPGGDA
ncbi:diguanylate cyclase [Deinococcus taeanensis]|uniref:HD domain-containing phosphohydrolase n=1 Tax=Deinococcus taeanensis TaxID=2737050 RepID=UPI001CDC732B|nr:HD domain-containing phosphohydrolase [Deinococcus taeanensis]UBV41667.1 diguanylate cyclase [Deinococcus taeanensis]